MEEIVSALHGIEFMLGIIFIVLFLQLMFKNCNGESALREIKMAIEDLTKILISKK